MKEIYLLESHYKTKERTIHAHKDKEIILFSLEDKHSFGDNYLWTIFGYYNIKPKMVSKVYFRSVEDLLVKDKTYNENSFKGELINSLIWFYKASVNVSFEETPQFDSDSREELIEQLGGKNLNIPELTMKITRHTIDDYWKAYSFKKRDLEARKEVSLNKGNKLGRQHSKKDEERKSDAMKKIEEMLNSKGKYKDYEIMEKTGIKRRTYYKYKKELMESKKELLK